MKIKLIVALLSAFVTTVAANHSITVEWDPNQETNIVGYNIKVHDQPFGDEDTDVMASIFIEGATTRAMLEDLPSGTWHIRVAAVAGGENQDGSQWRLTSALSQPLIVTIPEMVDGLRVIIQQTNTLTVPEWNQIGFFRLIVFPPSPE